MNISLTETEILDILSQRMSKFDIIEILNWAKQSNINLHTIYNHVASEDPKVASNALWVLTWDKQNKHIYIREPLISLVFTSKNVTIRRHSLTLLYRMQWSPNEIRADLIDFCMSHFLSETETPGVRALCIKLCYSLCQHYPELINELKLALQIISSASTPPAVISAKRNILQDVQHIELSSKYFSQ